MVLLLTFCCICSDAYVQAFSPGLCMKESDCWGYILHECSILHDNINLCFKAVVVVLTPTSTV